MTNIDMTTDEFNAAYRNGGDTKKQPNRKVTKSDRASLEGAFLAAWRCVAKDLPEPELQLKFHETRKWRFDFAWESFWHYKSKNFIDIKVAVEIQGGAYVNGMHNRGSRQASEHAKQNAANELGWTVLQFGTDRMKDPYKVAAEVAEVIRQKITRSTP